MQLTDHHTTMLQHLVRGEAWKVVMHVYGERLASLEAQIRQLGMDRDIRLTLMERRNELLDMIARFYSAADEENPFDAAAGTLWATTLKLPEPEPTDDPYKEKAEEMLASVGIYPPRKRSGGSVA